MDKKDKKQVSDKSAKNGNKPPVKAPPTTHEKKYLSEQGIDITQPQQLSLLLGNLYDEERFMPQVISLSALFTTRGRSQKRSVIKRQTLFHVNKAISIRFTGEELRAIDDELVWMQILEYSKSVPMGEFFEFTLYDLMQKIGWKEASKQRYEQLLDCLSRLEMASLEINNRAAYGVSRGLRLIYDWQMENDVKGNRYKMKMRIDERIALLFIGKNHTKHHWLTYKKLNPVARRLMDYIQSHRNPFPLDLMRFKELCGSSCKRKTDWRKTVNRAIEEIAETGNVKKIHLEDDKIYVERLTDM